MDFLEKDLEDIIWENLQTIQGIGELESRGLQVDLNKTFYRQYNFGAYGVCDLIAFKLEQSYECKYNYVAHIDIYELKKDCISAATFLQINRYAKACVQLINQYNLKLKRKYITPSFNLILVGNKVELSNDFVYLSDVFDNVKIVTYKIKIDGLKFKQENGYTPKNCGFLPLPKKIKMFKNWNLK